MVSGGQGQPEDRAQRMPLTQSQLAQAGQGVADMKRSISSRIQADSVSFFVGDDAAETARQSFRSKHWAIVTMDELGMERICRFSRLRSLPTL